MPVIAVAGIAVVVVAIFAVIALYSGNSIGNLIGKFGSQIPVIGSWYTTTSIKIWVWAINAVRVSLENSVYPLTVLVNGIWVVLNYVPLQIYNTFLSVYHWIQWCKAVYIPNTINAVESYSWNLYQNSISRIATALGQAKAYANSLYNDAVNRIAQALSTARSYAASLYNSALAKIAAALDTAKAYAQALAQTVLNFAATGLSALEAKLTLAVTAIYTLIGAESDALRAEIAGTAAALEHEAISLVHQGEVDVIHAIDAAAAVTITGVWPGIITDVDALLDIIPKELSDIRDLVARIPRDIPFDLTTVLEGLGALAIPFLKYLVNCGAPMCVNLHKLTDLFADLFSIASDALLLQFLILCVADPEAAAGEVTGVVHGVATETSKLFTNLLGL